MLRDRSARSASKLTAPDSRESVRMKRPTASLRRPVTDEAGDTRVRVSRRVAMSFVLAALAATSLAAQPPAAAPRRVLVRAGQLIDGTSDAVARDRGILITGDRITRVGPYADVAAAAGDAEQIDLRAMTVLPGLIDTHTHVLL